MDKKIKIIFAIVILKIVYDVFCFVTNLHELEKFIPNMIFNILLSVILLLKKTDKQDSNKINLKIYFVIVEVFLVLLYVSKIINTTVYLIFTILIIALFLLFLYKKNQKAPNRDIHSN